jgi:hypothetical protein
MEDFEKRLERMEKPRGVVKPPLKLNWPSSMHNVLLRSAFGL